VPYNSLIAAGVGRYGNPRDALRNTVIRGMRMPGYVPPSAAGANWTVNPAVRPPHAGAMLNRMPVPARGPMCIDPPLYAQPPAAVFQSVGPQGRIVSLQILGIFISLYCHLHAGIFPASNLSCHICCFIASTQSAV